MLENIKYIHECGYIHRDIKPDNFVINIKKNKLYCIDFGLAKTYLYRKKHVEFRKDHKFCGTVRYASISAHKGYTQSRRDDLEAIGYVLVYLFKASLPWMGIKHEDKKERYRLIMEKKLETSEKDLCEQLPREFLIYFKYIKSLDFEEKPRYNSLIKMFKELYESKKYNNHKFEWE